MSTVVAVSSVPYALRYRKVAQTEIFHFAPYKHLAKSVVERSEHPPYCQARLPEGRVIPDILVLPGQAASTQILPDVCYDALSSLTT